MKIIARASIGAFVFFCSANIVQASPLTDLSSPSQEARDLAAKILRATYTPPSRTNWDALASTFKVGSPKTNIQAQLQSLNLHLGGGVGSGNTEVVTYPLDDYWSLECSFTNTAAGSGLARVGLVGRLRQISTEPPTGFNGVWTDYYVNGQKGSQGVYKGGRLDGDGIGFYPDGSKATIHHWVNGVSDGEEAGFYPSGRIKYKGQYKADKQVGHWIWYKEDGSIESEKDYEAK